MMGLGVADCPTGQMRDPDTGGCVVAFSQADVIVPCPAGSHTDPVSYKCAPNVGAAVQAGMVGPGPIGWATIIAGGIVVVALIYEASQKKRR